MTTTNENVYVAAFTVYEKLIDLVSGQVGLLIDAQKEQEAAQVLLQVSRFCLAMMKTSCGVNDSRLTLARRALCNLEGFPGEHNGELAKVLASEIQTWADEAKAGLSK